MPFQAGSDLCKCTNAPSAGSIKHQVHHAFVSVSFARVQHTLYWTPVVNFNTYTPPTNHPFANTCGARCHPLHLHVRLSVTHHQSTLDHTRWWWHDVRWWLILAFPWMHCFSWKNYLISLSMFAEYFHWMGSLADSLPFRWSAVQKWLFVVGILT